MVYVSVTLLLEYTHSYIYIEREYNIFFTIYKIQYKEIYSIFKEIQIFSNAHLKIISPKDVNHCNFNTFLIYPVPQKNYRLLKNWRRPSSGKYLKKSMVIQKFCGEREKKN